MVVCVGGRECVGGWRRSVQTIVEELMVEDTPQVTLLPLVTLLSRSRYFPGHVTATGHVTAPGHVTVQVTLLSLVTLPAFVTLLSWSRTRLVHAVLQHVQRNR